LDDQWQNQWRFIRQDVPDGQNPRLDDSNWQRVILPHTYNAIDGQNGGNNYYRGPAWYRLHLDLTQSETSHQLYLRFDAASLKAQVYVNGQLAAEHRGAFTAFCFRLTPLVHPGENVIAVRVDNSLDPGIPPIAGDFNICGGLYRDVHLLVRNAICISPTDDASTGVYITPIHVTPLSADVEIKVELRNDSRQPQDVTVACKTGTWQTPHPSTAQTIQSIPADGTAEAHLSLTIPNPHLWNGRADPQLYFATIQVSNAGKVVDDCIEPFGIRTFEVTAEEGFFLNGRHLPLHGVCLHQDFWNCGWAVDSAEINASYDLIDEIGANAVRMVHYPRSDGEYTRCDRDGLIVWTELPLVNRINDSPAFAENARRQLRELIKQNYNHPSICFWGLSNELGPHTRTNWPLEVHLNELAHQLDPTRLTIANSYHPPEHPVNWIADLTSFSRYYDWYGQPNEAWPDQLDKIHRAYPSGKIAIGEYGAGASLLDHESPTTRPYVKGPWHPEEWQARMHEQAWSAMSTRPWLFGNFIFCMFDFASDARHEGDRAGQNDKGLVTADRLTRKDAFYFYKSQWSTDPFVHITSRRWTPRLPGPADLKIYSNCDTVELFLNGHSLGQKSSPNHIFLWPQIPLTLGPQHLHAVGQSAGRQYTDACDWTVSKIPTTRPATTQHWIPEPQVDPLL
jgi:beta-galactosidase